MTKLLLTINISINEKVICWSFNNNFCQQRFQRKFLSIPASEARTIKSEVKNINKERPCKQQSSLASGFDIFIRLRGFPGQQVRQGLFISSICVPELQLHFSNGKKYSPVLYTSSQGLVDHKYLFVFHQNGELSNKTCLLRRDSICLKQSLRI